MAKQRFQRTPRMQTVRLVLLAALSLGTGVSLTWAGQQSSLPGQAARQKSATATPVGSTKTATPRKNASASSSSSSMAAGKRDPFKLPDLATTKSGGVENTLNSEPGGVLPGGKRGLLISDLQLEGVIREQTENKMTAMVFRATDQKKLAYFLHESDSVYNGVVSKITPDSVTFKENVLDPNGHVTTREVVKRLSSASGEGR